MVAQFLGLKLRIMANSFRRSTLQVVGMAFGILYGLFITIVIVAALIAARFVSDSAIVGTVIVVVGSCVVLGFFLLPLIFGVDDTLDPRAFSLYGIKNRRLAAALAVAALIGVPSIVLSVCSLATVVTWSRSPLAFIASLVAAGIAVFTCVLGARVTTSIAAFLLSTRRSREFGGIAAFVALLLLSPLVLLLLNVNWAKDGISALTSIASVLSWTPLGAVWAIPSEIVAGDVGIAALKLLIACAFLGLIWLAWEALVARMLVTPQREAHAKAYNGLGWFGRVPRGSASAIAARTATYWGRDARYWVGLIVIPVFPALMVGALLVAGIPHHYLVLLPLPVMCLFLGWTIHNDVAYDSTAIWLHLVSGTRGFADRIGRTFPVFLIGIPLVIVGSVVTTILYGDWDVLAPVVGLSSSVLLIGVGLSSVASALFPYPATKPGDSAFSQPQASGASAVLVQSLSFVAIILLALPVIGFMALGLFVSPAWFVAAPVAGFLIGFLVLACGVYFGGKVFDRRGPEIMSFAIRND